MNRCAAAPIRDGRCAFTLADTAVPARALGAGGRAMAIRLE
jgi:hypothetical protein